MLSLVVTSLWIATNGEKSFGSDMECGDLSPPYKGEFIRPGSSWRYAAIIFKPVGLCVVMVAEGEMNFVPLSRYGVESPYSKSTSAVTGWHPKTMPSDENDFWRPNLVPTYGIRSFAPTVRLFTSLITSWLASRICGQRSLAPYILRAMRVSVSPSTTV